MTNCAVGTVASATAVAPVERARVRVGAGVAVAVVVVRAGATASEACVGAGIAVDKTAKGMAVGGVVPEHAVRTNSVRKTNPPCWSFLVAPKGNSFCLAAALNCARSARPPCMIRPIPAGGVGNGLR